MNVASFLRDTQALASGSQDQRSSRQHDYDSSRRASSRNADQGPYVEERELRKVLANLAHQPAERRKVFRARLQKLTQGNQTSYINVRQFAEVLVDAFP